MKKILALVLSVIMVLAMSVSALAGTITINAPEGLVFGADDAAGYKAIKVFDLVRIADSSADVDNEQDYDYTINPAFAGFTNYTGYAAQGGMTLEQYINSLELLDTAAKAAAMRTLSENLATYAATAPAGLVSLAPTNAPSGDVTVDSLTFNTDASGDGYYLIVGNSATVNDGSDSKVVGLYIMDSTENSTLEVTLKADAPSIDKKIDADKDGDGDVAADDERIGNKVNFVVTSKVPDTTGYTSYVYKIFDTMSAGLTFTQADLDALAITIEDEDGNVLETLTDSEFTATLGGTDKGGDAVTFSVTISQTVLEAHAEHIGEDFVLRYAATLNENAVIGIDEEDFNSNEVHLEYSNTPGDDNTGETPDKEVKVYTFNLDFIKYGIDGNVISNVIFNLFDAELDGATYVPVDENAPITFLKDDDGYFYPSTAEGNSAALTITAGLFGVKGLEAGTYILRETNAAAMGYDEIVGDIIITITAADLGEETANVTVTVGDHDNVLVGQTIGSIDITGHDDLTGIITVLNTVGGEFPSTGGSGTTMYTLGGLSMMAAAALVLFIKKSRAAKVNN